jgi:hypothetical protein
MSESRGEGRGGEGKGGVCWGEAGRDEGKDARREGEEREERGRRSMLGEKICCTECVCNTREMCIDGNARKRAHGK